jgi:hypothetical protein
MANRYPLVANSTSLVIEEISSSDTVVIDNLSVSNTANLGAVGNVTITGGTNGQILKTNGSGVLSWTNDASTPAGSNQQIQFNNASSFGSNANLTFDFSTSNLTLTGNANITGTTSLNVITGNSLSLGTGDANVNDVFAANSVTVLQGGYAVFKPTSGNNVSTTGVALAGPAVYNASANTYLAWALPNTIGNVGEFLTSNGGGQWQWATSVSSSVPGSNSATGQAGQIAFDSSYLYVCIAANTWTRVGIATWP